MPLIRKRILDLCGLILLIYTVIFMTGMIRSAFSEADVPNEYQEMTNVMLTDCFLKGINPYTVENACKQEEPGYIYFYGPLYSAVTALVGQIVNIDLVTLHYAVSLATMIISGILAAAIVWEKTRSFFPTTAAFLFIINCTWRYGYINAVPDSMAFMLVILVLFIETRKDFKCKDILEVLCLVAIFYTKIYVAFVAFPLFIYKLVKSRKRAIKFALCGLVITAVSVLVINITCPLLFTYCIYFLHGPLGMVTPFSTPSTPVSKAEKYRIALDVLLFRNKTDPPGGMGYEILQLRTLAGMFFFMFLWMVFGIVKFVKAGFDRIPDHMLLFFIETVGSIPALLFLGTNDGAWLSYYLQLMIPPLILFSLIFLYDEIAEKGSGKFGITLIGLYIVTVFFTTYRTSQRLPFYYMTPEQRETWDDMHSLLDSALQEGEVYYSPILAYHGIRNGSYIYNRSLNGRRYKIMLYEYERTEWLQKLFPYAGLVMKKNVDFNDNVLMGKIRNGEFSLITASIDSEGGDRVLTVEDIESGPYELTDEVMMPVSRTCYSIKLWRRIDNINLEVE